MIQSRPGSLPGGNGRADRQDRAEVVTPVHWLLLLASVVSTGLLLVASGGLLLSLNH